MSSFAKNVLRLAGLLLLAFAIALPASATNIGPGDSASPDMLTTPIGTPLASTTGTITTPTFSTTYWEWVYADANNTFCANCLDFVYQFTNNGPGVNERYTGYAFGGFSTDVGYDPATGTFVPNSVDRSVNGQTVGFNYITNNVVSGQTTPYLIIETNATTYVPGYVSAQDGTAGFGTGFSPAVLPTPEPATLTLLASGFLLAGGFLRKAARR